MLSGHEVDLDIVDVDTQEALRQRYGHKVPVLVADEEELCHFRLIPERVRRLLEPD